MYRLRNKPAGRTLRILVFTMVFALLCLGQASKVLCQGEDGHWSVEESLDGLRCSAGISPPLCSEAAVAMPSAEDWSPCGSCIDLPLFSNSPLDRLHINRRIEHSPLSPAAGATLARTTIPWSPKPSEAVRLLSTHESSCIPIGIQSTVLLV